MTGVTNHVLPSGRYFPSLVNYSFAPKVVKDGSKFIRSLIELSKKPKLLYHKVKISKQARADLAWWDRCLESHNGICAFPIPWSMDSTKFVFTDTSCIVSGIVCGNA